MISIALLFTFLWMLAAPVSADKAVEISKGTPVVDGKLDKLYLDSACYDVMESYVWSWGNYVKGDDMPSTGKMYFLWDENYLYICGVAKATTTSDGYIVEAAFPFADLKAGKAFKYSTQLIDIWDPAYADGYAKGSSQRETDFVCVKTEATVATTKAPTTTATTAAPTATKAEATTTTEAEVITTTDAVNTTITEAEVTTTTKAEATTTTSTQNNSDSSASAQPQNDNNVVIYIVVAAAVIVIAAVVIIVIKKKK